MNEHLVDRGREDVDGYSEVLYFLRRKLIEPIMEAHTQLFTVSAEYRVAALCEGNYAAAAILRQRFLADTAVFYELIDDGAELLLGHAKALAHASTRCDATSRADATAIRRSSIGAAPSSVIAARTSPRIPKASITAATAFCAIHRGHCRLSR